jgi:hypothetical protein
MTPKVIIRQNGILVDSNNEPLEDRIKELKRQIKQTDNNRDEKEDLKQQLSQLYNEAKVLIDLRGKLWVFLEPPHHEENSPSSCSWGCIHLDRSLPRCLQLNYYEY